VTYPKDYTPGQNWRSESLIKYWKWYLLASSTVAVILCYKMANAGVMSLLYGTETMTAFPYSFMFTLLTFGILIWLALFLFLLKLHYRFAEH
jgi:hypothetical protein